MASVTSPPPPDHRAVPGSLAFSCNNELRSDAVREPVMQGHCKWHSMPLAPSGSRILAVSFLEIDRHRSLISMQSMLNLLRT